MLHEMASLPLLDTSALVGKAWVRNEEWKGTEGSVHVSVRTYVHTYICASYVRTYVRMYLTGYHLPELTLGSK